MNLTKSFNISFVPVIVCLTIAGCAAAPELLPMSAVVPEGVDFSGKWQLRVMPGSSPARTEQQEPGIRIPSKNSRRSSGRRSSRGSSRTAVGVFIEHGESLKISQTVAGLFISFDRSVVEEYTFGEDRVISVGPIEAQRVSGWQDDSFIVRTLDDDGAILTESWQLSENQKLLVRHISIVKGDKERYSTVQEFDPV